MPTTPTASIVRLQAQIGAILGVSLVSRAGPAEKMSEPSSDRSATEGGCFSPTQKINASTKKERSRTRDACCYRARVRPPVVGRPLRAKVDDDRPVTAGFERRSDWLEPFTADVDLSSIDEAVRRAIAAEWAEDAALEHASIAEFSRVSLGLMALAAPPHLLHEAHAAALDEAHHARATFGIASFLLGQPIGPAPLRAAAAGLQGLNRVALIRATLEDGCIGECIASLYASAAAVNALDGIRDRLSKIAADEARHASFAYRSSLFLIEGASPSERDSISDIVVAAKRNLEHARDEDPESLRVLLGGTPLEEAIAEPWGRLSFKRRYSVWREAVDHILLPALGTLELMLQGSN